MAKDLVLVTGGTGNIGSAFVAHLAADVRAPEVRVASRDPRSEGAALVKALGSNVSLVAFDVERPDTMHAALADVTKLFVIAPFVPDLAGWHEKVAAVAKDHRSLQLVVKSSVTGARGPASDPAPGAVPLGHWKGEEAFRSAFPTIAIRPNIFMQHFRTVPGLYRSGDARFYLPTGNARVSWLDARDIAAVAAALVLAEPSARRPFEGNAYELSGPNAPTAAELATILSLVARKPIEHVDGVDAFSAHCADLGVPDVAKHFYGEAAGGFFAKVEEDFFVRLLGRHPTSFTKFAMDHASHFGGRTGD